jgi:hypothetical protein
LQLAHGVALFLSRQSYYVYMRFHSIAHRTDMRVMIESNNTGNKASGPVRVSTYNISVPHPTAIESLHNKYWAVILIEA